MPGRKAPAPRTAVRALILSPRNEVLLVRRQDDERCRDKWFCPGSWVPAGEEPAAELKRTLKDQLHLDIRIGRKRLDPLLDGDRLVEFIMINARPRDDQPEPRSEVWMAGWFTADEIRWHWGNIHEETRMLLKAAGFAMV